MMWNRETRILLQVQWHVEQSNVMISFTCFGAFFFKFHDFLSTLIIRLKFPDFFLIFRDV